MEVETLQSFAGDDETIALRDYLHLLGTTRHGMMEWQSNSVKWIAHHSKGKSEIDGLEFFCAALEQDLRDEIERMAKALMTVDELTSMCEVYGAKSINEIVGKSLCDFYALLFQQFGGDLPF